MAHGIARDGLARTRDGFRRLVSPGKPGSARPERGARGRSGSRPTRCQPGLAHRRGTREDLWIRRAALARGTRGATGRAVGDRRPGAARKAGDALGDNAVAPPEGGQAETPGRTTAANSPATGRR